MLRSYKKDLWNLLPSFCHHAKDTKKHFGLLAQFLIVALKDDPSTHESISAALKVNAHLLVYIKVLIFF